MGPMYLEGSWGREGSLILGMPFTVWEISQDRQGTSEAQRWVRQPACGRGRERPAHMVPANPLHSPARDAREPVCAVARYRNSGFSGQTRGEDLTWLHRQMEGPGVWCRLQLGLYAVWILGAPIEPPLSHLWMEGHLALPYQPCFGMLGAGTALPSEALGARQCRQTAHIWRQGWNLSQLPMGWVHSLETGDERWVDFLWLPARFRRGNERVQHLRDIHVDSGTPLAGRGSPTSRWGFQGTLPARRGRGLGWPPASPWSAWVHDCGGARTLHQWLSAQPEGHLGRRSVFSWLKRGWEQLPTTVCSVLHTSGGWRHRAPVPVGSSCGGIPWLHPPAGPPVPAISHCSRELDLGASNSTTGDQTLLP